LPALVIASLLAFGQSARAEDAMGVMSDPVDRTLCGTIEASAAENNLPVDSFTA
jgi:hypothetical protein